MLQVNGLVSVFCPQNSCRIKPEAQSPGWMALPSRVLTCPSMGLSAWHWGWPFGHLNKGVSLGPPFFCDTPVVLALLSCKLFSPSLWPYHQGHLIATSSSSYRGTTAMPLASVTESTRLSDLVAIVSCWTPLCQLLTLLLMFIMRKEIITASKDGGSRNSK